MKRFFPFVAFGALTLPFASMSAVNVELHRDIAPVVVNGEKIGFTLKKVSDVELENGINQLVVRVEKLVQSTSGEREKFNSKPVIMTFDAENANLELSLAAPLTSVNQAKQFDQSPHIVLKNRDNGQMVKNQQSVLPNGGGITRDYEQEVAKYNKNNAIVLAGQTALIASQSKAANEMNTIAAAQPALIAAAPDTKSIEMVKYWFEQSDQQERSDFIELAFEHRKSEIDLGEQRFSRSFEMMAYWYNESSQQEKKQIIQWLVSAE